MEITIAILEKLLLVLNMFLLAVVGLAIIDFVVFVIFRKDFISKFPK